MRHAFLDSSSVEEPRQSKRQFDQEKVLVVVVVVVVVTMGIYMSLVQYRYRDSGVQAHPEIGHLGGISSFWHVLGAGKPPVFRGK